MQVDGLNREQALSSWRIGMAGSRSRRSRRRHPVTLPAPCKSGTRPADRRHAGRRLSHPSWHRPARAAARHRVQRCGFIRAAVRPLAPAARLGRAAARCRDDSLAGVHRVGLPTAWVPASGRAAAARCWPAPRAVKLWPATSVPSVGEGIETVLAAASHTPPIPRPAAAAGVSGRSRPMRLADPGVRVSNA